MIETSKTVCSTQVVSGLNIFDLEKKKHPLLKSFANSSEGCICVCVWDREPSCCWRTQSADGAAGAGVYGRPDAPNAGGARIYCACLPPLKC